MLVVAAPDRPARQVGPNWAGVIVRTAIPLAILAGCQTLTMLTGGIDLSVGAVASMAGFLVAALVATTGSGRRVAPGARSSPRLAGLITGIGVGVFRVHPLIMTLGMSLVVLGLANVCQLIMVQTGAGVPPELRIDGLGTARGPVWSRQPDRLRAARGDHLVGTARTGYGRLLYAIGDNPIAARLSGVRSWQVLLVLYVISALWPRSPGSSCRAANVASVTLADSYVLPSVAAAVIGGTSILGGRGGYGGTIVGALILAVITALLSALGLPGGGPPGPVRRDHRGRRGRLHAGHRRVP